MTKKAYSKPHNALGYLGLLTCVLVPAITEASVLGDMRSFLQGRAEALTTNVQSVQTIPLPRPAMNINPNAGKGGGEVLIIDNEALLPEEGPSGTIADIDRPKNTDISRYVVRPGDTLSGIAKMFGVTVNTILWANDISARGTIRVGQELIILPVTGLKYTTKKGDTLASLAKRFGADAVEIANYNSIDGDLAVGVEIIIPDGEMAPITRVVQSVPTSAAKYAGYYLRPLAGGLRTQGIHGYNGVDIAAPIGTPIMASAAGEVIIARATGWNGGYGQYLVIRHPNGTQTLYSHASAVLVGVGQSVAQGQVIGLVGNSGKSTGPHLHFEIRGGPRNPF